MKTQTQILLELWLEARTRFSNQLVAITEEDLPKRLRNTPNSVGFLIRHIGDIELLFAKNVFGGSDLKVSARTVIEKHDAGIWRNLKELNDYVQFSFDKLKTIVEHQTDKDWDTQITTNEFGTKTKVEAFGRIVSHTAYHAGQIAIINKYGTF